MEQHILSILTAQPEAASASGLRKELEKRGLEVNGLYSTLIRLTQEGKLRVTSGDRGRAFYYIPSSTGG